MKTLLVPVDFSAAAENAVDFAVEWSKRYSYERIILLRTFYDSIFEGIIMSAEFSNVHQDNLNSQREEMVAQLNALAAKAARKAAPGIVVITAVSELPLLRGIFEVIRTEKPELIVVGSDHHNPSGTGVVAASVISIAKASPVRVLVVPSNSVYQPVVRALLPFNFNMLPSLERLNTWRPSAEGRPVLEVLNLDTSDRTVKDPEKFKEAQDRFQNLLKGFDYHLHFTAGSNLAGSIAAFTTEHQVQLIIALPGKHSFLYSLTHASISEAIYRNAKLPVLILK